MNPRRPRVLVADDDLIACRLLQAEFHAMGFEVTTVQDGNRAREILLDPAGPELAILDLNMPGIDGIELARSLPEAARSRLYLTLLTGASDRAAVIGALQAGFEDFLAKPVSREILQTRMRVALGVLDKRRQLAIDEARQALNGQLISLGHLASGVAHEINNPLAVIIGLAEQISIEMESDECDRQEVAGQLKKIRHHSWRISEIVKGMRQMVKEETSEEFEDRTPAQICEECLRHARMHFDENGVRLTVSGFDSRPVLRCRPRALVRAILNLLWNGLDGAKKSDLMWVHVEFKYDESLRRAFLRVSDSGPGLPGGNAANLRQPFSWAGAGPRGAAIGLAIANGIAESHGGHLEIDRSSKDSALVLAFQIAPPGSKAA